MASINRHAAHERAARVVDEAVAANATPKELKKHLRAIWQSAGLKDPAAKGSREFAARFGGAR